MLVLPLGLQRSSSEDHHPAASPLRLLAAIEILSNSSLRYPLDVGKEVMRAGIFTDECLILQPPETVAKSHRRKASLQHRMLVEMQRVTRLSTFFFPRRAQIWQKVPVTAGCQGFRGWLFLPPDRYEFPVYGRVQNFDGRVELVERTRTPTSLAAIFFAAATGRHPNIDRSPLARCHPPSSPDLAGSARRSFAPVGTRRGERMILAKEGLTLASLNGLKVIRSR